MIITMKKNSLVLLLLLTPGFLVQAEMLTPEERAVGLHQAIDARTAALEEVEAMDDPQARQAKHQAVREEFWGKVEALYEESAPAVSVEVPAPPVAVVPVEKTENSTPPNSILERAFGAFFGFFR